MSDSCNFDISSLQLSVFGVLNMRIKKIVNAKITKTFKEVGTALEPLTDEQYDELEKMVKLIKKADIIVAFDEFSDIILAKIPDNFPPKKREMTDGTVRYSCSFILPDEKWTNLLLAEDAEEVELLPEYAGSTVAIVGKIVTKKNDDDPDNPYRNIRGYRGLIILSEGPKDGNSEDF